LIVVANFSRMESAFHYSSGVPIWFNTLTHLDAIGIGILLAAVPRAWFAKQGLVGRIFFGIAGLACWLIAVNYYDPLVAADTPRQEILSHPIASFGCGAIMAAFIGASGGKIESLPGRVMVYLGKISYGLYVYHGLGIILVLIFLVPWTGRTAADSDLI
jgi:peptidoglycan/LPS O-acetylase OafA/YrhL